MTTTVQHGRRGASAAVLVVAGGALAIATWIGGQHGLAVGLVGFYLLCALIAYNWAGRDSDVGAALRAGGDERQRHLDRDATAITGLVMIALAIIGAIVSAAINGGDIGVYGLFASVGGATYAIAFAILSRRS
jgi:hypothetical protein